MIVISGYAVNNTVLEFIGSLIALPVDLAVPAVTSEPETTYAEGI